MTKRATQGPAEPADISRASGRAYWRSIDELVGAQDFRDFLHREFQPYASELLDGTRRHFLRIMGASIALAGAATIPGCRRPDHKILTYQRQPEAVIHGKPTYYATALPLPGGGATGVLAETFEGRPTKLEGNPLHPASMGKSSAQTQAAVLSLYDPDRNPDNLRDIAEQMDAGVDVMSWDDFEDFAANDMPALMGNTGAGVAFVMSKATSPSRDRLRGEIAGRWRDAKWHTYEAVEDNESVIGLRTALGGNFRPVYDLAKAKVILTLGRDFLGAADPDHVSNSRGFAASRYREGTHAGHEAEASTMNRLYVVESNLTVTGGAADHRLRLKPTQVEAMTIAIAAAVAARVSGLDATLVAQIRDAASRTDTSDFDQAWIDAVADDLVSANGACAIMAGPMLRSGAHAVVAALNDALGAVTADGPVAYTPVDPANATSSASVMRTLVADMNAERVKTIVIVGCNPMYDAPADLDFAAAYAKVGNRIHVGEANETAFASTIHLEMAHTLETWSDVVSADGLYSVVQPMIKPLFDRRGELDFLALLAGGSSDPYDAIRDTFKTRTRLSGDAFERAWRRTLHNGRVDGDGAALARPRADVPASISAAGSLATNLAGDSGLEVLFVPCPKVYDGRYANNGWLQELPHPITKVSWDNPALVSKATADRLDLSSDRHARTRQYNHARWIKVSVGGRDVEVPYVVMPGIADDTIVLTLGYGRTHAGRVADGTGFSMYPLRSSQSMHVARGAEIEKVSRRAYLLANTQDHWTMEGRAILREVDHAAFQKHGDYRPKKADAYDQSRELNFAARVGEESHTPKNQDVYIKPQQTPHLYYDPDDNGKPKIDENGNIKGRVLREGDNERRVQQWGMSIDLTTCTGCGTCTVACQAENNIPIVGKMEVAKGREMHWIRVDRYFASNLGAALIKKDDPRREEHEASERDHFADPDVDMVVMPVTCMHCESAPCEVVCPVNATVHGREGTNDMAYNRCVGTRYCSNNCPYKVRRFNYFDYGTKQFKGSFGQLGEVIPDELMPSNENFIPPRLREPISDVAKMQYNPHVTVRSRGVMEKCTYCIQRINQARVETKLEDLPIIPDGYFETACQQACPSNAIVFGDIYDPESEVHKMRFDDGRSYQLLSYLNTRARTTYNVRLRNPNPAIRTPIEDPWVERKKGHDDHGGDHGHDAHDEHADGRLLSLPILTDGGVPA